MYYQTIIFSITQIYWKEGSWNAMIYALSQKKKLKKFENWSSSVCNFPKYLLF